MCVCVSLLLLFLSSSLFLCVKVKDKIEYEFISYAKIEFEKGLTEIQPDEMSVMLCEGVITLFVCVLGL